MNFNFIVGHVERKRIVEKSEKVYFYKDKNRKTYEKYNKTKYPHNMRVPTPDCSKYNC